MIVGLLIRKAGTELVISARAHGQARRLTQKSFRGNFDEFARNFADATLHARLARLPIPAAQAVELDVRFLGAVTREQIDVLDRQKQLGVVGIPDLKAVVRRTGSFNRLQAGKAANTMVDMHNEIARRQTGRLGNEVFGPAGGAARPYQAVAKDVLLTDERSVRGLEAGFDAEHGKCDRRLGQAKRLWP